jgi:indole-3-glycerol phosphate synthase
VGINNRDLATFGSDLGTTLELLEDVPDEVIVVSESGIRGPEDAALLGDAGVDAILVGETLLRAPDPQVGARHLATIPRAASRRERVRG